MDFTEVELEIVLKALLNQADSDRAYRQMGVSDTLSSVVNQIEAQVVAAVKKPIQRELTAGKKREAGVG